MTKEYDRCPICLNTPDDPRRMPCKHIYCFKCIPRLHRPMLNTKHQIVLECSTCFKRFGFKDWSMVKYYATLNCVPYVSTLKFNETLMSSTTFLCSVCFNPIDKDPNLNHLDSCTDFTKNLCHACLIDHRTILKKTIARRMNQYYLLLRKNQQLAQQIRNKFESMKSQIDCYSGQLISQIENYCKSLCAKTDERKFNEQASSSSGYESFNEQRSSEMDYIGNRNYMLKNNIILTEPSMAFPPVLHEFISLDSNRSSSLSQMSKVRLTWSTMYSFHPSHLVFESESLTLFIFTNDGYISVYSCANVDYTLIHKFYLKFDEKSQSITIKSLTASKFYLIVAFNSLSKSILQFYSHSGDLIYSFALFNQYISQIRYDHDCLWCLELMCPMLLYFTFRSHENITKNLYERRIFISFKSTSLNPFRFAINQFHVAVMDRKSAALIHLYDKRNGSFLKQIESPFADYHSYDIELTNQMLIYRFPYFILLTQLDNEQLIEQIHTSKNLTITKGKSDIEFLVSMSTNDSNIFIVQCYVK